MQAPYADVAAQAANDGQVPYFNAALPLASCRTGVTQDVKDVNHQMPWKSHPLMSPLSGDNSYAVVATQAAEDRQVPYFNATLSLASYRTEHREFKDVNHQMPWKSHPLMSPVSGDNSYAVVATQAAANDGQVPYFNATLPLTSYIVGDSDTIPSSCNGAVNVDVVIERTAREPESESNERRFQNKCSSVLSTLCQYPEAPRTITRSQLMRSITLGTYAGRSTSS
jgi:hypothetical protein